MNRLTTDERRRANELRRIGTTTRAPRALAVEDFGRGITTNWTRNARFATLVTLVLGALLAFVQLAQTVALHGAGSLLDWLLPRL